MSGAGSLTAHLRGAVAHQKSTRDGVSVRLTLTYAVNSRDVSLRRVMEVYSARVCVCVCVCACVHARACVRARVCV